MKPLIRTTTVNAMLADFGDAVTVGDAARALFGAADDAARNEVRVLHAQGLIRVNGAGLLSSRDVARLVARRHARTAAENTAATPKERS